MCIIDSFFGHYENGIFDDVTITSSLYPVYTMKLARRASLSSQLHRVNGVLVRSLCRVCNAVSDHIAIQRRNYRKLDESTCRNLLLMSDMQPTRILNPTSRSIPYTNKYAMASLTAILDQLVPIRSFIRLGMYRISGSGSGPVVPRNRISEPDNSSAQMWMIELAELVLIEAT